MKLREKIIEEVKEIKAEPLMQKAPTAIEFVEDNYPEVLDYVSTEGRIAGLLRVLELLNEEEKKAQTPERRFEGWSVAYTYAAPTMLPDGSHLRASIDNIEPYKEPYRACITHCVPNSVGTGIESIEKIEEQCFDNLIEALLYLERVDLRAFGITDL